MLGDHHIFIHSSIYLGTIAKTLIAGLHLPFVHGFIFRLVPESPRWLMQRGRYEEADKILKKVARINKRPLPETFTTKTVTHVDSTNDIKGPAKGTLIDVLKRPRMRLRLLFSAFCWWVTGQGFYQQNNGDLSVYEVFLIIVQSHTWTEPVHSKNHLELTWEK